MSKDLGGHTSATVTAVAFLQAAMQLRSAELPSVGQKGAASRWGQKATSSKQDDRGSVSSVQPKVRTLDAPPSSDHSG